MKKFVTRADFFHKVRPDAGRKLYPRLEALLGAPFREVYRILRSTPYGASPVMYFIVHSLRRFAQNHPQHRRTQL